MNLAQIIGVLLTAACAGASGHTLATLWLDSALLETLRTTLSEILKIRYIENPTEPNRIFATGIDCFECISFWMCGASATFVSIAFGNKNIYLILIIWILGFFFSKLLLGMKS